MGTDRKGVVEGEIGDWSSDVCSSDLESKKRPQVQAKACPQSALAIPVWQAQIADTPWLAPGAVSYFLARGSSLGSCQEARLLWGKASNRLRPRWAQIGRALWRGRSVTGVQTCALPI